MRTDSSEVGTVIEEKAIKELPLNGRNFAALVYLAPGITPGQAGENLSGASTFNPRGASNFNALGSQANSNAWLIDGIDNNEFTFNTVIVAPSVEQVREFKVLSGVFSAEFGRGAGVVSVSTKSGTNTLHGTAYEFLRNDAFDARNFFVRKIVAPDGSLIKDPVPPLDRHQFGVAIGGAVVIPGLYDGHSRTFFFADYAGIRETRGVTTVNTVPTAATRIGDFSDYRDRNGNLIPIYDPLTTRARRGDGTDRARSVSQQHHSPGPPARGRPQHRQHLPAAEHRQRQFRQLHLDPQPRDHRQRVLRPRRPPLLGQRLVVRPVQLRQVQPRRAAGPGQLLSADACRGGRALRSRPVRRRHPEHQADDPRRLVQLLEGAASDARQRAADWLRQHGALHETVRLRPLLFVVTRHPGHQHQRDHDGPAQHRHHELHRHLRRAGVPAGQSEPVPLPGRERDGVAEGPSPAEVRLSPRRSPAVAVHPRQHAQRDQLRHQLRQQPA